MSPTKDIIQYFKSCFKKKQEDISNCYVVVNADLLNISHRKRRELLILYI